MNGIFNIDKPYGITSMDVIRQIRNATNISKVGHGGTLDPLASGVIRVAIGNSTRLLEYILNNNKKYLAEITLGVSTNTYDREGEITKQADVKGLKASEEIYPGVILHKKNVPLKHGIVTFDCWNPEKVGGRMNSYKKKTPCHFKSIDPKVFSRLQKSGSFFARKFESGTKVGKEK